MRTSGGRGDVFCGSVQSATQRHQLGTLLSHKYMFTLVPFTVLISWIFFLMEKVSDSVSDPFEGGVTDVPKHAVAGDEAGVLRLDNDLAATADAGPE